MQSYLHLENIQTHTFTTRAVDEEVDEFQQGRVSVGLIWLNPIIHHWLQRERTHTHSLKLPQLNLLSYTHSLHRKHTLQLGLDIITNHTHHWFKRWYIRALWHRIYEWIQCEIIVYLKMFVCTLVPVWHSCPIWQSQTNWDSPCHSPDGGHLPDLSPLTPSTSLQGSSSPSRHKWSKERKISSNKLVLYCNISMQNNFNKLQYYQHLWLS